MKILSITKYWSRRVSHTCLTSNSVIVFRHCVCVLFLKKPGFENLHWPIRLGPWPSIGTLCASFFWKKKINVTFQIQQTLADADVFTAIFGKCEIKVSLWQYIIL